MTKATVKLGLMPPLTGIVGIYGSEIVHAAQIACQEVNNNGGVLGRPLELIIEDDGSLPENAVVAAEKLIDRHHCKAIIGNLLSNSRIAVAYRVAEPRKTPLLNFSFYEGSILSRYFFHFAALPNQQVEKMIPYMQEKFGPSMFFAGNNYEWPRGSIQAAKEVLIKNGGKVVGEEYTKIGLNQQEIDQLLDHVEEQKPDVFVPYFAGDDQILLLTRFSKRGLKKHIAVVMGHYDEMMTSQLPPEVREGFYSSNSYFMSIDTPKNREYLEKLAKLPDVNGIWPNGNGILTNFGEGTYICVKAFAQAANKAGSLNSEQLVESLKTVCIDAPQGKVTMNPVHHHANINSYLTHCQADGVFKAIENFGLIKAQLPARYNHQRIKNQATLEDDIRLQARILESMTEGVFLVSSDNDTIIYANTGAEKIFGYNMGEMKNLTVSQLDDHDTAKPNQTITDIIPNLHIKGSWQGEIHALNKNREPICCSINISSFTHPVFGEVWLWVIRNITKRKQAELQLSESEEKYRLAMEATQDGFWDWKIPTGEIYFSPGWKNIMDGIFNSVDQPARNASIFPDDRIKMLKSLQKYLTGQIDIWKDEHRLCNAKGDYIWVLERGRVVERDPEGHPIRMIGTMTDISERKQVEEELIRYRDHLEDRVKEQTADLLISRQNEKEARQMLQLVLNSIPVRVFWKDNNLKYLGCNSLFAQDAGFQNQEEIVGLTDFDMGWYRNAKQYQADDKLVMENNRPKLAYEETQTKPDGSLSWLQTSKIPLHDTQDQTIGILGTYEDITDRKQAENQLILAKDEAQKANHAKSDFLANMSHELRTPLHGILSFARFGLKNAKKGDLAKLEQYFDWINQSGERLLVLLNDLLDLSKLESGKLELDIQQYDIKQIIENCVAEMSASIEEKKIQIHWQDRTHSTLAEFDKVRIGQVVTNLLSNAYKFSNTGDSILIDLSEYSLSLTDHEPIPGLLCSIQDEGIGIPEDELDSIFDKFIQSSKTKSKSGGTGLGLAISQEIIKAHHGKIWAENSVQGGATFRFAIPLSISQIKKDALQANDPLPENKSVRT